MIRTGKVTAAFVAATLSATTGAMAQNQVIEAVIFAGASAGSRPSSSAIVGRVFDTHSSFPCCESERENFSGRGNCSVRGSGMLYLFSFFFLRLGENR